MKALKLSIIALAAIVLGACATDGTSDEQTKATPAAAAPAPAATTAEAAPKPAEPTKEVSAYGPHIDASAFLNALVESGCQIDKAEYKEVKRGGAIKIVCSKAVDPLNVELDDL